jgi:hypothetical protein
VNGVAQLGQVITFPPVGTAPGGKVGIADGEALDAIDLFAFGTLDVFIRLVDRFDRKPPDDSLPFFFNTINVPAPAAAAIPPMTRKGKKHVNIMNVARVNGAMKKARR